MLEHNAHLIRNLDTPIIARDIFTYLYDKERAMKSLAEFEPTWGGDIATRMRAEAAAFQAANAAAQVAPAPATVDTPEAVGNAVDAAIANQAVPEGDVAQSNTSRSPE